MTRSSHLADSSCSIDAQASEPCGLGACSTFERISDV